MIALHIVALAAKPVAHTFRRWIFHLGGLGFIPLGLLDASILPIPGSMDLLTLVLSARQPSLWSYYAVMATIGAVMGAYVTYRLARKGGQEALARRVKPATLQKVQNLFERWGLGAIAIPAMLPPPVPMVPFVMAAGAMEYPVKKFLFALTLGRAIRYTLLAFLAARYGRHVLSSLTKNAHPMPIFIMAVIVAAAGGLFLILRAKRHEPTTN
ncbi:MAG: VTT domain-containing protein [Candidatus Korobacteraceae bacterium]